MGVASRFSDYTKLGAPSATKWIVEGWVAPATKRGCIATYKRALRKILRERMVCFFKSPRLSIQKIIPWGGARRGTNSPLRQNPRFFFSTRITSGDGGKLFGRIGELFGQKSKIT